MGSPAAPLTLHCPKAEPEAGEAPAAKFGSAGGHSAAPTAAHQQRRASFAARHQSTAHGPVARYPNQLSSSTRFSQGQESLFKKPCCILGRTRPLGGCHDVEAVEVPTTAPHRSHSTPPPTSHALPWVQDRTALTKPERRRGGRTHPFGDFAFFLPFVFLPPSVGTTDFSTSPPLPTPHVFTSPVERPP